MNTITGKTLLTNQWPEGKIIGIAKQTAELLAGQGLHDDIIIAQLNLVRQTPEHFLTDPALAKLARECLLLKPIDPNHAGQLRDKPIGYPIWGREGIDNETLTQMDQAMRLPVSIAGALMPDAHIGYGIPIGGVLAVENAVIPYAVGVDIACRMRLSLYKVSPYLLGQKKSRFESALMEHTFFGFGARQTTSKSPGHAVLDDPAWKASPLLRKTKDIAARQLGTSGSGNHFVEWGAFQLQEPMAGLKPGSYLALLSHSGSRGVGYKIAEYFSKTAMHIHADLDKDIRHLAWLPLNSEPGQEYWLSMELAGKFASACHQVIHHQVSNAVGLKEAAVIENHHNFAWAETLSDGTNVIVHRKGATPAGPGVLGVIPGSMGHAGYVVRGKGCADSLQSASHGAGRQMNRATAIKNITKKDRDAYLQDRGVTLLGGGLDESPQAYKPIDQVMAAQQQLVDIIGKFSPHIVRMADDAKKPSKNVPE